MKNFKNYFIVLILLISVSLFFVGCDATEPNESTLTMSLSAETNLPKTSEEFQIQEVKLLIKNIKIKNQADDDSLQVKTGPIVVSLDLNNSMTEFTSSEIPAGAYNRVRFEIHKIEDSEPTPDPEFKDALESSKRYSTIVKGHVNGEEFTYRSRKSAVQDIKLTEDLIVEEGTDANLTIKVDPYSWFYEGSKFLDPTDSVNDDKIDNNLKYAFKRAFCDKDKNGFED